MTVDGTLQRTLGLSDAVVIGAGSMIGAGVFAAWAPAADAAGTGLLIGLVVAALVAFCNASSSAQLAATHPQAGGTYIYGRRQLGPVWGHLAGLGIRGRQDRLVRGDGAHRRRLPVAGARRGRRHRRGRGHHPGEHRRTVAHGRGHPGTARRVARRAHRGRDRRMVEPGRRPRPLTPIDASVFDILQSAGFLFFAFAGYARIATLGEEVREPDVTIPRAIPLALGAVLVVYAVVGITTLAVVPATDLGDATAPLRLVAEAGRFDGVAPVVRIGAGVAALGVLLNLIPGVLANQPGDGARS